MTTCPTIYKSIPPHCNNNMAGPHRTVKSAAPSHSPYHPGGGPQFFPPSFENAPQSNDPSPPGSLPTTPSPLPRTPQMKDLSLISTTGEPSSPPSEDIIIDTLDDPPSTPTQGTEASMHAPHPPGQVSTTKSLPPSH